MAAKSQPNLWPQQCDPLYPLHSTQPQPPPPPPLRSCGKPRDAPIEALREVEDVAVRPPKVQAAWLVVAWPVALILACVTRQRGQRVTCVMVGMQQLPGDTTHIGDVSVQSRKNPDGNGARTSSRAAAGLDAAMASWGTTSSTATQVVCLSPTNRTSTVPEPSASPSPASASALAS